MGATESDNRRAPGSLTEMRAVTKLSLRNGDERTERSVSVSGGCGTFEHDVKYRHGSGGTRDSPPLLGPVGPIQIDAADAAPTVESATTFRGRNTPGQSGGLSLSARREPRVDL